MAITTVRHCSRNAASTAATRMSASSRVRARLAIADSTKVAGR